MAELGRVALLPSQVITNRGKNRLGYVALIAIQLGSCYRAELDLSPAVEANGGAAGSDSSVLPGRENGGNGGQANPDGGANSGNAGTAPSGGQGGGGGGQSGGDGGQSGGERSSGGAGGADRGWIPINQGGDCTDEPLTLEHEVCHLLEEKPSAKVCSVADKESATRFLGCYDGGCTVCTLHGQLPGYPYYFDWHPCCSRNDTCSNHDYLYCNALCPAPTEHDRVAPCGKIDPNPG